jgi:hypothetical protein
MGLSETLADTAWKGLTLKVAILELSEHMGH